MQLKINNIPSKKKRVHILPIIVVLVTVIVIAVATILLNSNFMSQPVDTNNYDYGLRYDDMGIPGMSYYIQIDTKTKALLVEVTHYCSMVDCNASIYHYGPTVLTDQEYTKIFSTINDGVDTKFIAPILESMARDQESFDSHSVGGATTRREFANQWLDGLIEELHK